MSAMIDSTESARLDDLTRVNSVILSHMHGTELDTVLMSDIKRRGRSDTQFRDVAVSSIHPDDLYAAIVRSGYSLSRFGIIEIR